MKKNDITPYLFGEITIRTAIHENKVLFCARDACAALGLGNNRQAIASLRDAEKITVTNDDGNPRAGKAHQMTFVTEPGLYRLIFKSRKAEALVFQDWVFHEVLPQIRKQGYYGRRELAVVAFAKDLMALGMNARETARLTMAAFPPVSRAERIAMDRLEGMDVPAGVPIFDHILAVMDPGHSYTIADLFSRLPSGLDIPRNLSEKAQQSRLGQILKQMRSIGYIETFTNSNRIRMYRRPADKMIPYAN